MKVNTRFFWGAIIVLVFFAIVMEIFGAQLRNAFYSGKDAGLPTEFNWIFTERGEDAESGAPVTNVGLLAGGKEYDVGTYIGSCAAIDPSSAHPLPYEQSPYVICWWAGGGVELGVFREGDTLVVKKGDVDEGSAEIAGFRGNFEKILEL